MLSYGTIERPLRCSHTYSEFASDRATAVKVKSDIDKDYVIGDVLGKGSFGLVKQGVRRPRPLCTCSYVVVRRVGDTRPSGCAALAVARSFSRYDDFFRFIVLVFGFQEREG